MFYSDFALCDQKSLNRNLGLFFSSHCHPGCSEAKSRDPEHPSGSSWVPDMFFVKTSNHSGMTIRPMAKDPKN